MLVIVAAASVRAADYDVVVYGGTAAGVTAAMQAKAMGKSVVIVGPDKHLGGLTSGGLGWTDTGNKAVIGGLAREFYHRVWRHYDGADAWRWQKKSEYGNTGQGTPAIAEPQRPETVSADEWLRWEQEKHARIIAALTTNEPMETAA